jgi:hypothetical protein
MPSRLQNERKLQEVKAEKGYNYFQVTGGV